MTISSTKRLGFFTRLLDEAMQRTISARRRADRPCRAPRLRFGLGRAASFPRGRRRPAVAVRVPGPCCRANLAHSPGHRHRHPAAGECRFAWRRTPSSSTCCPAAAWKSASDRAATCRPSRPSASTRRSPRALRPAISSMMRDAWDGGRCRAAIGSIRPHRDWTIASGRRPSPSAERVGRQGRRRPHAVAHPAAAQDAPRASLADIQNPMIDAYLEALPEGREPRILASRIAVRRRRRKEALRLAEIGATACVTDSPPPATCRRARPGRTSSRPSTCISARPRR